MGRKRHIINIIENEPIEFLIEIIPLAENFIASLIVPPIIGTALPIKSFIVFADTESTFDAVVQQYATIIIKIALKKEKQPKNKFLIKSDNFSNFPSPDNTSVIDKEIKIEIITGMILLVRTCIHDKNMDNA